MMDDIVAYMPIRLNSKRIANKNINLLGDMPLFCWSLKSLLGTGIKVYVYTNWEVELKQLCEEYEISSENLNFLNRPSVLDEDRTTGIQIYKQFSEDVDSKTYLLCHCTSPFVTTKTYNETINAVVNEGYDSAFTVQEEKTFCWHDDKPINFSLPRPRTQEIKPVYVETSAAYCYNKDILKTNARSGGNTKMIVTNRKESIDIDEIEDFNLAKLYIGG